MIGQKWKFIKRSNHKRKVQGKSGDLRSHQKFGKLKNDLVASQAIEGQDCCFNNRALIYSVKCSLLFTNGSFASFGALLKILALVILGDICTVLPDALPGKQSVNSTPQTTQTSSSL